MSKFFINSIYYKQFSVFVLVLCLILFCFVCPVIVNAESYSSDSEIIDSYVSSIEDYLQYIGSEIHLFKQRVVLDLGYLTDRVTDYLYGISSIINMKLTSIENDLSYIADRVTDYLFEINSSINLKLTIIEEDLSYIRLELGDKLNVIGSLLSNIENLIKEFISKDNEPIVPEQNQVVEDFEQQSNQVMGQAGAGLQQGESVLQGAINTIFTYSDSLLAVSLIFGNFVSIPLFSGLVSISLGLCVLSMVFNIGIDVSRKHSSDVKAKQRQEYYRSKSANQSKGG